MSKSLMSLVWIAGPLSGTLGQPIVGVLSDELRWSYGRRRPFMIGGAVATIFSLLTLSWSREIVGLLTNTQDPNELDRKTIPLAVAFVYILDFSISVIQAATRAFIVDNVPTIQQQEANAWAARLIGIGNIVGFILGAINLPKLFPSIFGRTQFQVLAFCASMGLVFTVAPACLFISEQDPNTDLTIREREQQQKHNKHSGARFGKLHQIWNDTVKAIRELSPQTRLACAIEFFAWIGYFPMLFYGSTYVGTLYKLENPNEQDPEAAVRRGSTALLFHAIVSLVANFLLPYLLTVRLPAVASPALRVLRQYLTTVNGLWVTGHIVFLIAMTSTFFISTSSQATAFITILGIPWAIALWAPFVIISEEVSRIKNKKVRKAATLTYEQGVQTQFVQQSPKQRFETFEHESGIILGVHNMFVALPQMVSSLMAAVLFKIFDASNREDSAAYSLGWVYRFGGLATAIALYLSLQLKDRRELDSIDDDYVDSWEE
ncbi:hypothetical protein D0Z00_003900 [Geotrichum galactomycetum]|uniref:Uncharacterized protein n=1 Tax=Geotrichum galactomycetum TaxID=27317 RepID=A0ACB6UZZ2_9ASCO|nr:hypothetical protein D0Z00_003900 [Geotrichum candidum]